MFIFPVGVDPTFNSQLRRCLPRSYKLWRAYLQERQTALKYKAVTDKGYTILINTYERALVHLHKMPVSESLLLLLSVAAVWFAAYRLGEEG